MSDEAPATDLGAVFDAHVRHEFEDRDVDATRATMVAEPDIWHVPTVVNELVLRLTHDDPALVPAAGVEQARELLKLQRG